MTSRSQRSGLVAGAAFVLALVTLILPLAPTSTAGRATPLGATASVPSIVDVADGGRTETAASVLVGRDQPALLAQDRSSDWLRPTVIVLVALVVLLPALWIHLGIRHRQRSTA